VAQAARATARWVPGRPACTAEIKIDLTPNYLR